jgi:hypothetical protein
MFLICATMPLNDNTRGFRFNVLGLKGLLRVRRIKRRALRIERGDSMTALHVGKLSIYAEHKANKRRIRHFAG